MTKKPFPLEKISEIEDALKRLGTIKSVSLETGLARAQILHILHQKHQTKSLVKIKRAVGFKKPLSPQRKEKILTAKRIYDQLGTLESVGKSMSITRERVRQLLIMGVNHGLFEYTLGRDKRFENLLAQFSREKIAETIKQFPSPSNAASKLGIKISELERLLDHFAIDLKEHRSAATRKSYIERYARIVNTLGYDPATTMMQKNPEWRATWAGISRLWGSMDNFRHEFGIVPNFTKRTEHMRQLGQKHGGNSGWKKQIAARQAIRREVKNHNKSKIQELLNRNKVLLFSQINAHINVSNGTLYRYLHEMITEQSIVKIGSGNQVKYTLPGAVIDNAQKFTTKEKEVLSCFNDNTKALDLPLKIKALGKRRKAGWKRRERAENILSLFNENKNPLSLKQVASTLGLTKRMCWPIFKKLQNQNKIIKISSGKHSRYCLPGMGTFVDRSAKARRDKVFSQFNNLDTLSLGRLVQLTGYSTNICWKTLKELWLENKVAKIGRGNRVKYRMVISQSRPDPNGTRNVTDARNDAGISSLMIHKVKASLNSATLGGKTMNPESESNGEKESKEAKFKRLAERRVNMALDKIRLIGNLSSPQYSFSSEQVDKIILALQEAVSEVENKFKKPSERKKKKFEF